MTCVSEKRPFVGGLLQYNKNLCTDLANRNTVFLRADHLHFNAIHQTLELVPDITGSSHGAKLDEILIAPLSGVAALNPLREKHMEK